jgi:hypothetical protein
MGHSLWSEKSVFCRICNVLLRVRLCRPVKLRVTRDEWVVCRLWGLFALKMLFGDFAWYRWVTTPHIVTWTVFPWGPLDCLRCTALWTDRLSCPVSGRISLLISRKPCMLRVPVDTEDQSRCKRVSGIRRAFWATDVIWIPQYDPVANNERPREPCVTRIVRRSLKERREVNKGH